MSRRYRRMRLNENNFILFENCQLPSWYCKSYSISYFFFSESPREYKAHFYRHKCLVVARKTMKITAGI